MNIKNFQIITLAFALILPIEWHYYEVKKGDSFYKLFKNNWETVARFNRIDEKHLRIGAKIKIPNDLEKAKSYEPMPLFIEERKKFSKSILVDLQEQWLGAYQNGQLLFSAPISSGMKKCLDEKTKEIKNCLTPTGKFSTLAIHRDHFSSIYKDAENNNIPMPFAIMFFIDDKGIAYWLHGGDLPGYPASHGCIRLMKRDAEKLYKFVAQNNTGNAEIQWLAKNKKLFVEIK